MGKEKYHLYDKIGPHEILLLFKYKQGNRWRGIFLCPFCGRSFDANLHKVAEGNTTRCYFCTKKRRTALGRSHGYDLTGRQFGQLTVIKKAYSRKESNKKTVVFWECQCACGNFVNVETNHLTSGHTQSCGCIKSRGERNVAVALNEMNIDFEREKTFDDLPSLYSKRLLRFDFYLPVLNCCIECDGTQHIPENNRTGYFSNNERLERLWEHDKIKNEYCKAKGIKLYRIPQKDYDAISVSYLMQLLGEIG